MTSLPTDRELAEEILKKWRWNPSDDLGPEGIKLRDLIATAIQQAREEERARATGIAENFDNSNESCYEPENCSCHRGVAKAIRGLK